MLLNATYFFEVASSITMFKGWVENVMGRQ